MTDSQPDRRQFLKRVKRAAVYAAGGAGFGAAVGGGAIAPGAVEPPVKPDDGGAIPSEQQAEYDAELAESRKKWAVIAAGFGASGALGAAALESHAEAVNGR